MRPKRLIGLLVVGAMLGSATAPAPAQAHRDHDDKYLVYVAPIAAIGVLAVVALATGVLRKKPQTEALDRPPRATTATPEAPQRDEGQGGPPGPRPLRFGLGCQQGLTEATVLCW
jgi:hypothetical protein